MVFGPSSEDPRVSQSRSLSSVSPGGHIAHGPIPRKFTRAEANLFYGPGCLRPLPDGSCGPASVHYLIDPGGPEQHLPVSSLRLQYPALCAARVLPLNSQHDRISDNPHTPICDGRCQSIWRLLCAHNIPCRPKNSKPNIQSQITQASLAARKHRAKQPRPIHSTTSDGQKTQIQTAKAERLHHP